MLVNASARNSEEVTPSDTTPIYCDAIYVGTGGRLSIKYSEGSPSVWYRNVPTGTIIPVKLIGGFITESTMASDLVIMSW